MPPPSTFLQSCYLLWTVFSRWTASAPLQTASAAPCPGYVASNVHRTDTGLTADLTLAGQECNIFGKDLHDLKFVAEYQTDARLHVSIFDKDEQVYQVPDFVVPRPSGSIDSDAAQLEITIEEQPFSFTVTRKSNKEVLFTTQGSTIVFEDQYVRLRTSLPSDPSLYGLGEHTDPLMLPTSNYTRTMWARDAGGVPQNSNLYGTHPVYFEHRSGSGNSHGVLLLNSNGMDIKINDDDGQYLEYNTVGGIVDLYFLAGPNAFDVAREYSDITNRAAMMPYWGFGFHQCRFGYSGVDELAAVVANYSAAKIPLETMWTDIDYMDHFKVFTLGTTFPVDKMRAFIDSLHENKQHYIVMVDPAVAYQNYSAFNDGVDEGIFLTTSNGSIYKGRVWPGVTAFPDWFNDKTQTYWTGQFREFFDANTGVDIDALWIDMNEPSNFCEWPCDHPDSSTGTENSNMHVPSLYVRQISASKIGLPGRNLTFPPYAIQNEYGILSEKTARTDLVHAGGYVEYDTHNLYGTMMSRTSQQAMLARRPTKRPMVITRSTFVGAGSYVGHWLGDNISTWDQYVTSIRHLLQFVAFFQVPMVGADVCGFLGDTTESLCARWTVLGSFYPFYRNHNVNGAISQEAYRWDSVAAAARKAIDIRYRLLDYIYTAMHQQHDDGTPMLAPLWMHYPSDPITRAIDTQFFYGPDLLVSPVTTQNSTSVSFYLPSDTWYDLFSLMVMPANASGTTITYPDVALSDIPVHIRGGAIIPARVESSMTTTDLRTKDFELLVATDSQGNAQGALYLDDGESLVQADAATSSITFRFDGSRISANGTFGFDAGGVKIASCTVLSAKGPIKYELGEGLGGAWSRDVKDLKGVNV